MLSEGGKIKSDDILNQLKTKANEADSKPRETSLVPTKGHSYGKPWYEVKENTCRMCSKTFWHGQFIKHIKLEHALPLKDYRMSHPDADMDVDQYKCLVCGALMAHYSSPISGHLTSKHGITITEYYEEYHKHQPSKETLESIEKMKIKEEPKDEVVTPVTSTVRSMSKSTFNIKSIVRQVRGCDQT